MICNDVWRVDLPEYYFDHLSNEGICFGHQSEYPDSLEFSGMWNVYENTDEQHGGIYHSSIKLQANSGRCLEIKIPKSQGRSYCFTDFSSVPSLACYPSIFQAKNRLLSYCFCTTSWDGLCNSSIVTIDVDSGKFYNQYFDENWIEAMRKICSFVDNDWSNGGVQLYLNEDEDRLLLHSSYSNDPTTAANVMFKWSTAGWVYDTIIPGGFPDFPAIYSDQYKEFVIGGSSLYRSQGTSA